MAGFDSFVVFGEMRTGSNFLEDNLNRLDGVRCLGEAFNPQFIGYPEQADIFGVTQKVRETDPDALLQAMRDAEGLCGFRFFHDHDSRVLDTVLEDRSCAKIILTRNPVDSYISRKIAAATGQWKLTNVQHAKSAQAPFAADEFEDHLQTLQEFQVLLLGRLQRSGQTAFYIGYDDLNDVEVINGLAAWLGVPARLKSLSRKLKKQNPAPMVDKVENIEDMAEALARLDRFNLSRTPNFEPRRGPGIPGFAAGAQAPLLFMPLRTGPTGPVQNWLARLDGVSRENLRRKFTQSSLRDWMRETPGHRAFTVLRHPLARAHVAFCSHILPTDGAVLPEIRATLQKVHGLELPDQTPKPEQGGSYDLRAHREQFGRFLGFLRANLTAQTAVRVDAAWASQLALLQGMAEFCLPDMILREERLRDDLAVLAGTIGLAEMPDIPAVTDPFAARLAAIYDDELEQAARQAYARDYVTFGFGDWRPASQAA